MGFCHGNGNLETDGCCWVAGQVCPLRWKVVNGRVLEGPALVDRGTPSQAAALLTSNGAARTRITTQAQGATYLCRAALEVIAANSAVLTNRAALDAAWNTHAQYAALVRPEWAKIEERLGLAAGSYQCSTWMGTGVAQCCFAEDEVTNAAKRATLAATAVTVRQARVQ